MVEDDFTLTRNLPPPPPLPTTSPQPFVSQPTSSAGAQCRVKSTMSPHKGVLVSCSQRQVPYFCRSFFSLLSPSLTLGYFKNSLSLFRSRRSPFAQKFGTHRPCPARSRGTNHIGFQRFRHVERLPHRARICAWRHRLVATRGAALF